MEERTIFIKPCPYCGSVADMKRRSKIIGFTPAALIRCTNSKCGLLVIETGATEKEATDRAVIAWNQREAEE